MLDFLNSLNLDKTTRCVEYNKTQQRTTRKTATTLNSVAYELQNNRKQKTNKKFKQLAKNALFDKSKTKQQKQQIIVNLQFIKNKMFDKNNMFKTVNSEKNFILNNIAASTLKSSKKLYKLYKQLKTKQKFLNSL